MHLFHDCLKVCSSLFPFERHNSNFLQSVKGSCNEIVPQHAATHCILSVNWPQVVCIQENNLYNRSDDNIGNIYVC